MTVTLYGSPMSLFTGRVRSYFVKAGIDFRELPPVSDHYEDVVLPLAGGRRSMPTVELSNGTVIRDSVAIVDHFEAELGGSYTPTGPKQRTISLLLDLIGTEGMYRPAMHYRWRYPEHITLIRHHFEEITPKQASPELTVAGRFQRMAQACNDLGASEQCIPLVESLYIRLLKKMNTHFAHYPYFLGGKPSIGDFGMFAPMYAHLGRDLKPLSLMHEHGVHVLRWVERMQRHDPGFSAAHKMREDYLDNDEIPATLIDLVQHMAIDFVPETVAASAQINAWLDAQTEAISGREVARSVGTAPFNVEDQAMSAATQPFRFYLLKRLQDHVRSVPDAQGAAVLEAANMQALLACQLARDIERDRNLEVWQ